MYLLRRLLCLLLILALTAGMGGLAVSADRPDDSSVTACCDTTADHTVSHRERLEVGHSHCGSGDGDCMDPYCALSQAMLASPPLLAVPAPDELAPWTPPAIPPVFLPGLDRPPRLDSAC